MQDLTQLTDEQLIAICLGRRARDERAFTELVRRYQLPVQRICLRIMRNDLDAEDMAQETLFRVYRYLDQYSGQSSFGTWLHRLAVNCCLNELRRRKRRPQEMETPIEELGQTGLPVQDDRLQASRVEGQDLVVAFLQLPAEQQEALRLRDLEERSYAEIAQLLGIGLSAAKMRVQRARVALIAILPREQATETHHE